MVVLLEEWVLGVCTLYISWDTHLCTASRTGQFLLRNKGRHRSIHNDNVDQSTTTEECHCFVHCSLSNRGQGTKRARSRSNPRKGEVDERCKGCEGQGKGGERGAPEFTFHGRVGGVMGVRRVETLVVVRDQRISVAHLVECWWCWSAGGVL